MASDLTFDLHALVARLDALWTAYCEAELGISYRRFLPLFMVRELGPRRSERSPSGSTSRSRP